ncbi:MAG: hypothetical protein KDE15_15380 [Erythrobacter sp.]|nr:hypothetical protein [Erythrobacter sp.]
MRHLLLATLPLLLAACSGGADDAASDEAADAQPGNPYANAALDLQGTGIVVPAQEGFEELALPFGSARAPTEATLGNVLGAAVDESHEANDCGLTFTRYEGVTLSFRDDVFAGYSAEPPYSQIGTRAQLLADPNISMVPDSTLGDEFVIGAAEGPVISGLFDGAGDDAGVAHLWAGETCVAR